jgi:hypothetical protein
MSNDKWGGVNESFAKTMVYLNDQVDAESVGVFLMEIAFYHRRQDMFLQDLIRKVGAQQSSFARIIKSLKSPNDGPDELDAARARIAVREREIRSVVRTELFRMYEQEKDVIRVLKEKYRKEK